MTTPHLSLPVAIHTKADITRLLRELGDVEETSKQDSLRGSSKSSFTISRLLEEAAHVNDVDLAKAEDRKKLSDILKNIQASAPVLHISFAATPSSEFMQKITAWFRQEIHPYVLLRVGLQPSIAAGCTLRTTNKYFDLSLRRHLAGKENILTDKFRSTPS
jgi:hypothetical protein